MKILHIHIDAFGKLENFDFSAKEQFNLVYGSNEAGKSTLLAFIRAIFYGLNDRAQKKLQDDPRRRYRPWSTASKYGGHIVFEHDGQHYRINRSFGETKRFDKTQFFNEFNNEEILLPKGREPGEYLLSISEDEFVNTVFIGQMQSVMSSSQDIKTKLMQLTAGTGPDISPEEMCERLKEQKKNYRKSSVNSPDKLLEGQIQSARQALDLAMEEERQRQQIREEILALDTVIEQRGQQIDEVKRALGTEQRRMQVEDYNEAIVLDEQLAVLANELDQQANSIGDAPWPDQDAMRESEQLLLNWSRFEERLSTYQEQLTQLKVQLDSYPEEALLADEHQVLTDYQKRLAEIADLEQLIKDESARERSLYDAALAEKQAKLQEIERDIERIQNELLLQAERYDAAVKQKKLQLDNLAKAKDSRLVEHTRNLEQIERDLRQVQKRMEELDEDESTSKQRLTDLEQRIRTSQADEQTIHQHREEAAEQLEAAKQTVEKLQLAIGESPDVKKPSKGLPIIVAALGIVLVVIGLLIPQLFLSIAGAVVLVIGLGIGLMNLKHASERNQDEQLQVKLEGAIREQQMIESHMDRYDGQLKTAQADLYSRRQESNRLESDIERTKQQISALLKEKGDLEAQAIQLKRLDESTLLHDLIEDESNLHKEMGDLASTHETYKSEVATQVERLERTKQSETELVTSFEFKLSESIVDKQVAAEQQKTVIWNALSDGGIETSDRLKAAIETLATQITKRQSVFAQLQAAEMNLDAVIKERTTVIEALAALMSTWIDVSSLEMARVSWQSLNKQLQLHDELRRQYEALQERAKIARKGLERGDIDLRIKQIEQWLSDNEASVKLYDDYGAQALADQESDLNEQYHVELTMRGSKKQALDDLEKNVKLPTDIETEIAALEESYQDLLFQIEAIDLAIKMIEDSDKEIRQTFGPQIDQKTNEYLARLTGKQNAHLKVSSQFSVELSDLDSMLYEHDFFSQGKIDQIFLALRLAIGESIYDKDAQLPFFYDDILVQYDKERANNALSFLVEHSKEQNRQVFFITCHEYICEHLKNLFDVEAINLRH